MTRRICLAVAVVLLLPTGSAAEGTTAVVAAKIETGAAPCGVVAGAGAIWVSNASDGTVVRVDPASTR